MSKVSSLEEIILDKADLNSGKFITPTIEEEVKSNPQVKDASVTPNNSFSRLDRSY